MSHLKNTVLFRAQAVFLGRLSISFYYLLIISLAAKASYLDVLLVIISFASAFSAILIKNQLIAYKLNIFSLIADLIIHLTLTRHSGYLLSPHMAIHPFLTISCLLLFNTPQLILLPIFTLPIFSLLTFLPQNDPPLITTISSLILYFVLDINAIFLTQFVINKEQKIFNSLMSLQNDLQKLALNNERKRLAREFHDGAGAKISSIIMQCDYLDKAFDNNSALSSEINDIRLCSIEAIEDMRRSIAFLHNNFDIAEQIEILCTNFIERHKLDISLENLALLQNITIEQQIASCRIIQESLTNTLKHAKANIIKILVNQTLNTISIAIIDNGIGFNQKQPRKNHYGLKNMYDRAKNVGANLVIDSKENNGTKITIFFPLKN